jgi:hypothetical protein
MYIGWKTNNEPYIIFFYLSIRQHFFINFSLENNANDGGGESWMVVLNIRS